MACWQVEGCFIMFCFCRYDKMSEGGTSGYGGAPETKAKGAMVENSMEMLAQSTFCARLPSSPRKIWFFFYHNSQ